MAAHSEALVAAMLTEFQTATKRPEEFLGIQPAVAKKFRLATKTIYDFIKESENSSNNALPELIVDNFDDEQIWQELELQNECVISSLIKSVSQAVACKNIGFKIVQNADKKNCKTAGSVKESDVLEESSEDDVADEVEEKTESDTDTEINKIKSRLKSNTLEQSDDDGDSDELDFDFGGFDEDNGDDNEDEEPKTKPKDRYFIDDESKPNSRQSSKHGKMQKSSSVDDKFFKLSQMEIFLEEEDKKEAERIRTEDENRNSEDESDDESRDEDVNIFGDLSSDEDETQVCLVLFLIKDWFIRNSVNVWTNPQTCVKFYLEGCLKRLLTCHGFLRFQGKTSREMKYSDFFLAPEGEKETGDDKEEADYIKLEQKKFRFAESLDNSGEDRYSSYTLLYFNTREHFAVEVHTIHGTRKTDFKKQFTKRVRNSDEDEARNTELPADSESEGEDAEDILGRRQKEEPSFEKRQDRLKKKISDLEEASLAEKPWQLAGEVSSAKRPENSLLEEFLQFDQTTKLPPVITEETTKSIEDIIRQRIKDQAWDDVERKIKPKEDPFEYKKRIVLDQEKSKQSLGEIYEKEYLKQQQKEEVETKDPDHEEIKKEMRDLFIKLDALSNFHFTPKPAAPEIKVISNLPSINMEEVAPVVASDATLLAPEEVQDKVKGETKGQTEKTETDRKRERREKKAAKRERQKERAKRQKLLTKLHPGLGNKYSKEKAMKELEKSSKQNSAVKIIKDDKKQKKSSTSSKTFFTQLQEEVVSQISKRKLEKGKKLKMTEKSSKKLKL
ncbi:LOW QUALITY PROTEIN: U3 small nucleolar ribonucleoprotein protein MPP10-like [Liolophura sinensis]|uniref:LOW QUALITY PROTEIN: U3 small nucleolar ribonucleoprotein protein MPP10-like n=1 Tax=Liolophura sinensis TaxID=3198878 RepID=UPI003158956E